MKKLTQKSKRQQVKKARKGATRSVRAHNAPRGVNLAQVLWEEFVRIVGAKA